MNNYISIENISKAIEDIPADSIISKTILKEGNQKVILFAFSSGQELSDHTSKSNAIIHIISGEGSIRVDSEEIKAQPGTWLHIKSELPHSIQADTDLLMLLYMFPKS